MRTGVPALELAECRRDWHGWRIAIGSKIAVNSLRDRRKARDHLAPRFAVGTPAQLAAQRGLRVCDGNFLTLGLSDRVGDRCHEIEPPKRIGALALKLRNLLGRLLPI